MRPSSAQALRKPSKGEATRQSILKAAEAIFAESGYDAAHLESIAEEVGVKQAALFYHFPGKQKLFDAIMQDIHGSLVDTSRARLLLSEDPWEQLMLLVGSWLDFMVSRPTAARLILRNCANMLKKERPLDQEQAGEAYSEAALQLMRTIITQGVASGRFAEVNAMYLVNLLSGSILHFVCNPEQLGREYSYRPDDPEEIGRFKEILRKTARAVLDVQ